MFDKIKAIKRHIKAQNPAGQVPCTIESVRLACMEHLDIDALDIQEVDLEDSPVKGRYQRYEYQAVMYQQGPGTKISIVVCAKENYCWRRYIACKEMCQAIFDSADEQVQTLEQLERLITGLVLPDTSKDLAGLADKPLGTETLSEHFALEILCPVEDRKELFVDFQTEKISAQDIATTYRIPAEKVAGIFDAKTIHLMDRLLGIDD